MASVDEGKLSRDYVSNFIFFCSGLDGIYQSELLVVSDIVDIVFSIDYVILNICIIHFIIYNTYSSMEGAPNTSNTGSMFGKNNTFFPNGGSMTGGLFGSQGGSSLFGSQLGRESKIGTGSRDNENSKNQEVQAIQTGKKEENPFTSGARKNEPSLKLPFLKSGFENPASSQGLDPIQNKEKDRKVEPNKPMNTGLFGSPLINMGGGLFGPKPATGGGIFSGEIPKKGPPINSSVASVDFEANFGGFKKIHNDNQDMNIEEQSENNESVISPMKIGESVMMSPDLNSCKISKNELEDKNYDPKVTKRQFSVGFPAPKNNNMRIIPDIVDSIGEDENWDAFKAIDSKQGNKSGDEPGVFKSELEKAKLNDQIKAPNKNSQIEESKLSSKFEVKKSIITKKPETEDIEALKSLFVDLSLDLPILVTFNLSRLISKIRYTFDEIDLLDEKNRYEIKSIIRQRFKDVYSIAGRMAAPRATSRYIFESVISVILSLSISTSSVRVLSTESQKMSYNEFLVVLSRVLQVYSYRLEQGETDMHYEDGSLAYQYSCYQIPDDIHVPGVDLEDDSKKGKNRSDEKKNGGGRGRTKRWLRGEVEKEDGSGSEEVKTMKKDKRSMSESMWTWTSILR